MKTGDKIAKERKELNLTQEQLAQMLEVSRQSVSKWESGLAYPETDKLIKMGKIFGCSMDYLLNDDCTDKAGLNNNSASEGEKNDTSDSGAEPDGKQEKLSSKTERIKKAVLREHKSSIVIGNLPLYHIGRNAEGLIAVGEKAKGILAVGLFARGVFTIGLISVGVFPLGLLSIGLLASGCIAVGAFAFGAISIGLAAFGAISLGIVSVGAAAFGDFSIGAYAAGRYAAIGDTARGMVAVGHSHAYGELFSFESGLENKLLTIEQVKEINGILDDIVPSFLSIAKDIFIKLIEIIYSISSSIFG